MRIAAVDLVSNTCFPALAAEELGFYTADRAWKCGGAWSL